MVRKSKYVAADPTSPAGRIRWVMDKLFAGSQTRMAHEFGLSQAAISNVLLGKRIPGREMLMLIGSHPLLSLTWVLTGGGDPIEKLQDETTQEHSLPIADQPLPGAPDTWASLLSGERYPTARLFTAATRYWLRVHPHHVAHLPDDPDASVGAMLLMETDKSVWNVTPEALNGKLVIVRGGRGGDLPLSLYRIAVHNSSNEMPIMTIRTRFATASATPIYRKIVPEGVEADSPRTNSQLLARAVVRPKYIIAVALQALSRLWP